MSFTISSQTLSAAWDRAQSLARELKASAQAMKAASLAGPVASSSILFFEKDLRAFRDQFNAIAAIQGIAAYVGKLDNTPVGYNVTNEFTAMVTQTQATDDWVRTNFPKDATGYLLERQWDADPTKGLVERTFSSASLAGFRTQLDALIATL